MCTRGNRQRHPHTTRAGVHKLGFVKLYAVLVMQTDRSDQPLSPQTTFTARGCTTLPALLGGAGRGGPRLPDDTIFHTTKVHGMQYMPKHQSKPWTRFDVVNKTRTAYNSSHRLHYNCWIQQMLAWKVPRSNSSSGALTEGM